MHVAYFNTSTVHFFIILCYDQQMHNYFTNYHTPTYFETIVSSSGNLYSILCQVTQVFQTQLLIIQFKIMMFHTGFVQHDSTHTHIAYTATTQADVTETCGNRMILAHFILNRTTLMF